MDLARILLRVAERDVAPETPGRYRVGDARHAVPDVSRMKAAGWEAQSGLETMAREYWQWLLAPLNLHTHYDGADHPLELTGTVRGHRAGVGFRPPESRRLVKRFERGLDRGPGAYIRLDRRQPALVESAERQLGARVVAGADSGGPIARVDEFVAEMKSRVRGQS